MLKMFAALLVCIGIWAGLTILHVPTVAATSIPDPDPLCMMGDRRAFVVFVRFKGDTTDVPGGYAWPESTACYQWRENPQTALMPWMSDFLSGSCSDPGSCPDTTTACAAAAIDTFAFEPSLTDYYDAMSNGKYWLWGTVHPSVEITDDPRSGYASGPVGIGEANLEILQRLDTTVNFSDYDRNPVDGYVDQIILVYRTFREAAGYTGLSWIAGPADTSVDSTFVTNDFVNGVPIKIDLRVTGRRPSGVAVEGQNIQIAIHHVAHEAGHHFFSRGSGLFEHLSRISSFGVMDVNDAGMTFSAFERERMGWISPSPTTTSQTGLTLGDAFRGGTALKILVAAGDSTEYFLVENRARKSWYDADHPELDCTIATSPQGVAIYHVDQTGSADTEVAHKLVDVETPEGLFEAPGGPLDRTKPNPFQGRDTLDVVLEAHATSLAAYGRAGQANTFGTYTSPNSNGYKSIEPPLETWIQRRYSGVNLQNIIFHAADSTATMDLVFADSARANHVFRPGSGAYTATWKGTLYLAGDVTVDSLATLDLAAGTTVKSRKGFDVSALYRRSGVDTGRVELVVAGGGLLDVNGTSASPVLLTSAQTTPDTANWYGIRLEPNGSATLDYAHVGYGILGVSAAATPMTLDVANSRLHHHAVAGIFEEAVADTVEIRDSVIDSCAYVGIYLVQKKSLTAAPSFRTKIHNNRIFGNSYAPGGWVEVGLDNLGGTGVHRDSLWQNAIGSSAQRGQYGIYSYRDAGMSGSHATSVYSDSISYFRDDGVTLDGVTGSLLRRMNLREIRRPFFKTGRALVLLGGSSATVDESKFEGSNYTHVWNDDGCTIALTDSNAFYNVAGPDTMVWNWDTSVTMMAQRNWWHHGGLCNVGPEAQKFFGLWDRTNHLCTAPTLSLPDPWLTGGSEDPAFELSLALTPNPCATAAVIRYEVQGSGPGAHDVDISLFNVEGERVGNLLRDRRFPGAYELGWVPSSVGGRPISPGVYFIRFTVDGRATTTKVVIDP